MKTLSSSNWESSYFGGFLKLLWDYPEIRVTYKINKKFPKEDYGLKWYTQNKLADLFLLKVNEFDLIDHFTKDAELMDVDDMGRELVMSSKSVSYVLELVIKQESELHNLFDNYKEFLSKTVFSIDVDGDDKKGSEGEKNGEGDDENKLNSAILRAQSMLDGVRLVKETKYYSENITGELKKETKFVVMPKRLSGTKYTDKEVFYAEHLLKMLDISFDPKSDVVNNLKTGKLTISKLAEIPAGNLNVYHKVEENQSTKPFSVCVLADESGSMGGVFLDRKGESLYSGRECPGNPQHSLLKVLYKCFSQIVTLDKIYVYGHSGRNTPEIRVYHDKYNQCFEYTIDGQKNNDWCQNYDGPVIECIYEKVREMTDDNIIFITLSDGRPGGHNYGGMEAVIDMKRIIEKCKRDGFVTIGVGMLYPEVREIYAYNTVVEDLENMPKQVSLLINKVVKTEFQT